jgi:hypothetical protein
MKKSDPNLRQDDVDPKLTVTELLITKPDLKRECLLNMSGGSLRGSPPLMGLGPPRSSLWRSEFISRKLDYLIFKKSVAQQQNSHGTKTCGEAAVIM